MVRNYWALFLGAVVISLVVWPIGTGRMAAGAPAKGQDAEPVIQAVWRRPSLRPASFAVSPDGAYTATILHDGTIICYNSRGGTLWKVRLEGVNSVALTTDGSAVAARLLSPEENAVYFIAPDGKIEWQNAVHGAVWALASSPHPGTYAAGTGERYCYVYNVTGKVHKYRRWRTPGVPCSIQFTWDGRSLLIGTWQDAGVGLFTTAGEKSRWWEGQQDRLYSAQVSPTGSIVAAGKPNQDKPLTGIHVKTPELNDIWSRDFDLPGFTSDSSLSGDNLAVGYENVMTHKNKRISEKRIALYDRTGHKMWEKGGIFGKWSLLQVCSSGNLLLTDESTSVSLVSRDGDIVLRAKLPAPVRSYVRSPRRDRITLYLGNGELCQYITR